MVFCIKYNAGIIIRLIDDAMLMFYIKMKEKQYVYVIKDELHTESKIEYDVKQEKQEK